MIINSPQTCDGYGRFYLSKVTVTSTGTSGESSEINQLKNEFESNKEQLLSSSIISSRLNRDYSTEVTMLSQDFILNSGGEVPHVYNVDDGYDYLDLENRIGSLVVKHAYYQDQLMRNFTGDELKSRLAELDRNMDEKIAWFSKDKANLIGDLINSEDDNLYENGYGGLFDGEMTEYVTKSKQEYLSGQEKAVNKDELEHQIAQAIKEQMSSFEKVKATHYEEWQSVLNTGGVGINRFHEWEVQDGNNAPSTATSMSNLGYRDIVALSGAVRTMSNALRTTGSSVPILADLGLGKAKLTLYLENKEMPEFLRVQIWNSLNQADSIKKQSIRSGDMKFDAWRSFYESKKANGGVSKLTINEYMNKFKTSYKMDEVEKKSWDFNESFEQLAKVDRKQFVKMFLTLTDQYKDFLINSFRPIDPGPEPERRSRNYANRATQSMIADWNQFAASLFSGNNDLKEDYTIPVKLGDKLDIRV